MKVYLTAALLAALAAAPAHAQQMGGSTDGGSMASDSGGDMTVEVEIPATRATEQELEESTVETQIPVTESTSRPADIETPDAQAE